MDEAKEKLHKVLARAGVGSRRACEEMIAQGRVLLRGRPASVADRVGPDDWHEVTVDGRPLEAAPPAVYILLHKPRGFITTARDPQGRPTVMDLVREVGSRVYPVGRLDGDTSELLILTNDGELAHALTHPRHEVTKVYRATVEGLPSPAALATLRQGVRLDDGLTAPARVERKEARAHRTVLEIEIHEGRNRQVRRMCEAVGHPVVRLERVSMGSLTAAGVPVGSWRFLEDEEIRRLRVEAGLERAASANPRRNVHKTATRPAPGEIDERDRAR